MIAPEWPSATGRRIDAISGKDPARSCRSRLRRTRARIEGKTSSTPTPAIGAAKIGKLGQDDLRARSLPRAGAASVARPIRQIHCTPTTRSNSAQRVASVIERLPNRRRAAILAASPARPIGAADGDEAGGAGQLEQEPEGRDFARRAARRPEDHALKAYRIDRILEPVDEARERHELGVKIAPDRGDVAPVHALSRRPQCRRRAGWRSRRATAPGTGCGAARFVRCSLVLHHAGPRPIGERRIFAIVQSQVSPSRVKLTFFPSANERDA